MLSSSAAGFLTLPPEVRILIYHGHLTRHRQVIANAQPNNSHLHILRTCRTVNHEAREILQTYISLRYERQIHNFIHRIAASSEVVENITWADVANDGRFANAGRNNAEGTPASDLHIALRKLTFLHTLRVFETRQGFPIRQGSNGRLSRGHGLRAEGTNFERAMYPKDPCPAPISKYAFHLDQNTSVHMSATIVPTSQLRSLRVSGMCALDPNASFGALQQFVLAGVKGTYFELSQFCLFKIAPLETFVYMPGDPLSYEIRDFHLAQLFVYSTARHTLRTLVLLKCTRLTTSGLADCVRSTQQLEYLAVSFTFHEPPSPDFIFAVPGSIRVFKYAVAFKRFSPRHPEQRRVILQAIEDDLLMREPKMLMICVDDDGDFTPELTSALKTRWASLSRGTSALSFGSWVEQEQARY